LSIDLFGKTSSRKYSCVYV